VHRLDQELAARAEDAAELAQRLRVPLAAGVADGREEVEDRVEAAVGKRQLAIVGLDELELGLPRPAPRFVQEHL